MTTGTDRRQATGDNLVGATEITPQLPPAPQMQVPSVSAPNVADSASAQLNRALTGWASKKFQERANVENEAATFEGEMAFMQGRAFEDLEMEGNRWALQGYRVMDAEARSGAMLAAQQQAIRNGDRTMGADEYRDTYVNRLEQQLEGLDPQTAQMVKEQMYGHMPALVRQQTAAHASYLEQRSYDSLVNSIHPMSMDPSARSDAINLLNGGEDTAAAGLSVSRQRQAIVAGVTRAFDENNPEAYQLLARSGTLQRLHPDLREDLESARAAYQTRRQSTFEVGYDTSVLEIQRAIEAGELTPNQAVRAREALDGEYAYRSTAARLRADYSGAQTANDNINRSNVVAYEAAQIRGDMETIAELSSELVTHFASNTPTAAYSSAGPEGRMQVTPAAEVNTAIGNIRPSNGTPRDNARVRQDYWQALVSGNSAHISLNWEPGDVEAATIAQAVGIDAANAWIASGRDNSTLNAYERNLAENVMGTLSGEDLYYTAGEQLSIAQDELSAAQSFRDAREEIEDAEVQMQFGLDEADLVERFHAGELTSGEFQASHEQLRTTHGIDMTTSMANSVVQMVQSGIAAQAEVAANESMVNFQETANGATQVFKEWIAAPGRTADEITTATDDYLDYMKDLSDQHGFTLTETNWSTTQRQAMASATTARAAARKTAAENLVIEEAIDSGTVSNLPPALRTRAEDKMAEESSQTLADAAAQGVEFDQDAASAALQQANWIQAGTVSTAFQQQSVAAVNRPFALNGEPNQSMIAAITQFATLNVEHPEVAATVFGNTQQGQDARRRALAAMDLAGSPTPTAAQLGEAMVALQASADASNTLQRDNVNIQSEIIARSESAVQAFMGQENAGVIQGMFSGDAAVMDTWDRLNSEENDLFRPEAQEAFTARVTAEAVRMQQLSPGQPADFYVARAAAEVTRRAAFVGETSVFMDPGYELSRQMFGNMDVTVDGVENKVILSAIKDWQAEDPDNRGFVSDLTALEAINLFPNPAGGLATIAAMGAELVGAEEALSSVIGEGDSFGADARGTLARGVRPYQLIVTNDRNVQGVRIRMPDGGLSQLIPIDLGAAGSKWYDENIRGQ